MALLIALFAMTLMTFIAVEVSYDTSVDYVVAAQQVNRIKARYAAKSGVELSLLRIMLYKQVMAAMGDTLGTNKGLLDPIWSFPFTWPPTTAGVTMTEVDKDLMKDAVGESMMQAQYATTITPESGRLDINDLGSSIQSLKKATMAQVLKIFEAEVQNNEEFRKKYSNYRFEELINNIADYIDEDRDGLNGGDESAPYRDLEDKNIEMPPNRPLRTIDELHQVGGMKDDFYNVLAPRVTIYGAKGININYAGKDLLMSLDPSMKEETVDKVIARRNDVKLGGPFHDDNDFFGFIAPYGVNVQAIQESKIPLLYDMEFNFRIVSTGLAANVKHEITAVTYDFANLSQRLAELMDKQDQDQSGGPSTGTPPPDPSPSAKPGDTSGKTPSKTKIQGAKGRPNVVYWEEN
jgi:general secretion pathway protein K